MDGQTTITINGKAVGVRFNMQAVAEMAGMKGSGNAIKNVLSVIWGGILGFAFIKQQEPEVTFEEVCDWYEAIYLDGKESDDVKKVMAAFESSKIFQEKFKPAVEENSAKKNEIKKNHGRKSSAG
jgi:hypothetical protein